MNRLKVLVGRFLFSMHWIFHGVSMDLAYMINGEGAYFRRGKGSSFTIYNM